MANDNEISKIILQELRDHRKESNERHIAIDKRIRKVENWQANASGKLTALGVIGVAAGSIVTWLTSVFRE